MKRPLTVGALAAFATVVLVIAPYLLLPPAEAAGLGTYYDFGLAGPWAVAVLALVATVIFLAGRQNRSDPETVVGATLVVGVVAALLAAEWAVAVDESVVLQIATADWLAYHRWLVVAAAAVAALAAVWAAYARGLV